MSSRTRKTRPTTRPRPYHRNGDISQQHVMEKNRALIELVEGWLAEDSERDPQEVQAEWEEFSAALDADRLSDRKLFPCLNLLCLTQVWWACYRIREAWDNGRDDGR